MSHWNDNLAAISEAILMLVCQTLSIVLVGAVNTILPEMDLDLMFSLWFKK